MKFIIVCIVILFFSCAQTKQQEKHTITDNTSTQLQTSAEDNEEVFVDDEPCDRFMDSMIALGDTPVWEDDITPYKHLFSSKEVYLKRYHLTFTKLNFETADSFWNKQLNEKLNGWIKEERYNWYALVKDTLNLGGLVRWENWEKTIQVKPLFVSNKWVTVECYVSSYQGGMASSYEGWYLHFMKGRNGELIRVPQKDFFIYDKDTSVRYRYYHTVLKGMDTEINGDSLYQVPGCSDLHAYHSFYGYTISLNYFIDPENSILDNPYLQEFNLIPTKNGLKTKPYLYASASPRHAMMSDFHSDYIIPYKSLKGIIKEKYLKLWME